MNGSLLLLFIACLCGAHSFAPTSLPKRGPCTELRASQGDGLDSRRQIFSKLGAFVAVGLASAVVDPATAADEASSSTIWLTGKAPKVPDQKPRDPKDTKGTRRDPSFLRSLSDCKAQCENFGGPEGFARTKEDCLSDCQDICCTTYEQ